MLHVIVEFTMNSTTKIRFHGCRNLPSVSRIMSLRRGSYAAQTPIVQLSGDGDVENT